MCVYIYNLHVERLCCINKSGKGRSCSTFYVPQSHLYECRGSRSDSVQARSARALFLFPRLAAVNGILSRSTDCIQPSEITTIDKLEGRRGEDTEKLCTS